MIENAFNLCTNFIRSGVHRLAAAVQSLMNGNDQNTSFAAANNNTQEKSICPHCNAPNNPANMFCEKCGKPLYSAAKPTARPSAGAAGAAGHPSAEPEWIRQLELPSGLSGFPLSDWIMFIGSPNFAAPIYISQFARLEKNKFKLGFSLSAFLFAPYYFAYRKMWKWALVAFVLSIISSVGGIMTILQAVNSPVLAMLPAAGQNALYSLVSVLSSVGQATMTVFAPYLYHKHALGKMQKLRKTYPDNSRYHYMLVKQGGVSLGSVFLMLGLTFLYSTLLTFLFYNDFLLYWQTALEAQGGTLLSMGSFLLNWVKSL